MAENLEKEFEVKSRLLTELQKALDQRIEEFGRLEMDLHEKTATVGRLEQSLDEKTDTADRLQAELDEATAAARQLEMQLQAAQGEILQQKAEIDQMKNLLSYKIGRSFGNKFGDAPGVTLFEKALSGIFRQNYDELSNSKKPMEAADDYSGQATGDPDKPPGPGGAAKDESGRPPEPEEMPQDSPHKDPEEALQEDPGKAQEPGGAPQDDCGKAPEPEEPEPAAEEDLYEFLKPKLSPGEKAGLAAELQKRLASTRFAHGESLALSSTQLEMCIDSKSNMLDEWELACLCSCIMSFDWKRDDYVVEIGTNIGRTAVFMAKVLQGMRLDTKIISIDPFSSAADKAYNPKGNYFHYVTLTRQQGIHGTCIPVTSFSQSIPNIFREGVGVLLVDGSHQYEDVREDLDHYTRLVRPNGYVFVDDYNTAYPGVYRAFEEWHAAHDNFELSYKDRYFVIAKKISN